MKLSLVRVASSEWRGASSSSPPSNASPNHTAALLVSLAALAGVVGCTAPTEQVGQSASSAISGSDACEEGYTGYAADFTCLSSATPAANSPVRPGFYQGLYGSITVDVASPKDGSATWNVGVYTNVAGETLPDGSIRTNCNAPIYPGDDGPATIQCSEGGRCWFHFASGHLDLWSPTDPDEVVLFHSLPLTSSGQEDAADEGATYVWVRPIASSDTSCDCQAPPQPPSPPTPQGPGYQGPPIIPDPDPPYSSLESPLVVSFTGAPLQFTGKPVAFDFYGNGTQPLLDWLQPPAGFVALDLNGNGTIDSGRELFGTSTILVASGQLASNGFAALAQYDTNGDGAITAADAVYAKLLVWTDLNVDGVSQPNEIVTAAAAGITTIPLQSTPLSTAPVDATGTTIGSWVSFSYYPRNVCQTQATAGSISDVWFAMNAPAPTTAPAPAASAYGTIGVDSSGDLDGAILQCVLRNGGTAAVGAPFDNGGGALVHPWSTGMSAAHVVSTDSVGDTEIIGGPTGGVAQDFTGGSLGSSICMHETSRATAWMVHGWIRNAYFAAGGPASFLGYPVGDEFVDTSLPPPYDQVQQFEGGYIAWDAAQGAFMPYTPGGCDTALCAEITICGEEYGHSGVIPSTCAGVAGFL